MFMIVFNLQLTQTQMNLAIGYQMSCFPVNRLHYPFEDSNVTRRAKKFKTQLN